MERINSLNVRVYGLLLQEHKIMFLKEIYKGKELLKLPGGGLELGESTIQTLKREFQEELNLKIKVKEHFYTQDFVIQSKITPESQLLAIYYHVECLDFLSMQIKEEKIKEILWLSLEELKSEHNLLPVDRIVINKLNNNH